MALVDIARDLVEPWLLLAKALQHVPQTVRAAFASRDAAATLLSPAAFSAALFGHLWATLGPEVKEASAEHVVPLLEGRVAAGRVHHGGGDDVVGVPVGGVVVEVGAGSGMWADVLAAIRRAGQPGPITAVYGVEPNPRSAAALRRRVAQVGLGDVYRVVPFGIEAVGDRAAWDGHIAPGSVDCIVGILCLCSIPDPQDNVRRLYELLKPGGR